MKYRFYADLGTGYKNQPETQLNKIINKLDIYINKEQIKNARYIVIKENECDEIIFQSNGDKEEYKEFVKRYGGKNGR